LAFGEKALAMGNSFVSPEFSALFAIRRRRSRGRGGVGRAREGKAFPRCRQRSCGRRGAGIDRAVRFSSHLRRLAPCRQRSWGRPAKREADQTANQGAKRRHWRPDDSARAKDWALQFVIDGPDGLGYFTQLGHHSKVIRVFAIDFQGGQIVVFPNQCGVPGAF
jgi:hypothetical protein